MSCISDAIQVLIDSCEGDTLIVKGITFGSNTDDSFKLTEEIKNVIIQNCHITSCDSMFKNCESLETVTFKYCDFSTVRSTADMFYNCYHLKNVEFGNFNSKLLRSMSNMFYQCTALENIDLSSFKYCESYMNSLFCNCSHLKTVDFGNMNTSNVVDMSKMFQRCWNLEEITIPLNTESVTDMSDMFWGCEILKTIDMTNCDTSNVENMAQMFWGCEKLTNIEYNFNTSKVKWMDRMFGMTTSLKEIDISKFDTAKLTSAIGMFESSGVQKIILDNFNFASLEDCNRMFNNCIYLEDISLISRTKAAETINCNDFVGHDRDKTTIGFDNKLNGEVSVHLDPDLISSLRIGKHFSIHDIQTDLIVVKKNEDSVKVISELLYESDQPMTVEEFNAYLATLELVDGIVTVEGKRINMHGEAMIFPEETTGVVFSNCIILNAYKMFTGQKLASIAFHDCETIEVFDCSSMFSGCDNLISVDMTGFQTNNVVRTNRMFYGCSSIEELSLSTLNTAHVVSMADMFAGCSSLKTIELDSFQTANVVNMSNMFNGCISVNNIWLDNFKNTSLQSYDNMFGSEETAIGILNNFNGSVLLPNNKYFQEMIEAGELPLTITKTTSSSFYVVHNDFKQYAIEMDQVNTIMNVAEGLYSSASITDIQLSGEKARYDVTANLTIVYLEKNEDGEYKFGIQMPKQEIAGLTITATNRWSDEEWVDYAEQKDVYEFTFVKDIERDAQIYLNYSKNDKVRDDDVVVKYTFKCNISRFEDMFAIEREDVVVNVKSRDNEVTIGDLEGANNNYILPVTIVASNVKKSTQDDVEGYWIEVLIEHKEFADINIAVKNKWSTDEIEPEWLPYNDEGCVEIDDVKYDVYLFNYNPEKKDRIAEVYYKYDKVEGDEDDVIVKYSITLNVSTYEETFAIQDEDVIVNIQPGNMICKSSSIENVNKTGAHASYDVTADLTVVDLKPVEEEKYEISVSIAKNTVENVTVQWAMKWELVEEELEYKDFEEIINDFNTFTTTYVEGRGNLEIYYKYSKAEGEDDDVVVKYSFVLDVNYWIEKFAIDEPNTKLGAAPIIDHGIPKLVDSTVHLDGLYAPEGEKAYYEVSYIDIMADMNEYVNEKGEIGLWIGIAISNDNAVAARVYWCDEEAPEFAPIEEVRNGVETYHETSYNYYLLNYDPNKPTIIIDGKKQFRYGYVEYKYSKEDCTDVIVRYIMVFSVHVISIPEQETITEERVKELLESATVTDGILYEENYKLPLLGGSIKELIPEETKDIQLYNCTISVSNEIIQLFNGLTFLYCENTETPGEKKDISTAEELAELIESLSIENCGVTIKDCKFGKIENIKLPPFDGINRITFENCEFPDKNINTLLERYNLHFRSCMAVYVARPYAKDEANIDILPAPLVDNQFPEVTGMTCEVVDITSDDNLPSVTVNVTVVSENMKKHYNGIGQLGYWIGVGILNDEAVGARAYWEGEEAPEFLPIEQVRDSEFENHNSYYFEYVANGKNGVIEYLYEKEDCISVTVKYILTFDVTIVEERKVAITVEEMIKLFEDVKTADGIVVFENYIFPAPITDIIDTASLREAGVEKLGFLNCTIAVKDILPPEINVYESSHLHSSTEVVEGLQEFENAEAFIEYAKSINVINKTFTIENVKVPEITIDQVISIVAGLDIDRCIVNNCQFTTDIMDSLCIADTLVFRDIVFEKYEMPEKKEVSSLEELKEIINSTELHDGTLFLENYSLPYIPSEFMTIPEDMNSISLYNCQLQWRLGHSNNIFTLLELKNGHDYDEKVTDLQEFDDAKAFSAYLWELPIEYGALHIKNVKIPLLTENLFNDPAFTNRGITKVVFDNFQFSEDVGYPSLLTAHIELRQVQFVEVVKKVAEYEDLEEIIASSDDTVNCNDLDILAERFPSTNATVINFVYCKFHTLSHFFEDISAEEIHFHGCDFSEVTSCDYCFYNCSNLRTIKIEFINENIKNIDCICSGCDTAKRIEICNCNLSGLESMEKAFFNCGEVTDIDIHDCEGETTNLTNVKYALRDCKSLKSADLRGLNMSAIENATGLFYGTLSMTKLLLPPTFTGKALCTASMIFGVSSSSGMGGGKQVTIECYPKSAFVIEGDDAMMEKKLQLVLASGLNYETKFTIEEIEITDDSVSIVGHI